MAYRFTIVNERTLQPLTGWVEFRSEAAKTGRWVVPPSGIEFLGNEWEGFDTIAVGAEGFGEYSEPMDFSEGDYEFRLRENDNWLPWLLVALFAGIAGHHYITNRKTT